MAKPPSLAGKASSFLSVSLGGGCPVMCGRNQSLNFEIVRSREGQYGGKTTINFTGHSVMDRNGCTVTLQILHAASIDILEKIGVV